MKYNATKMFKPSTKDIFDNGEIKRVFSKTISFKSQELRCSGGIFLPKTMLDLLNPKEQENILRLFSQGLLIISLTTASDYFCGKPIKSCNDEAIIANSNFVEVLPNS